MSWAQVTAESQQPKKLCVMASFSFWTVCWPGGLFLVEDLLQSFCYGDNECLLSPNLKCSEVYFEKGIWGFFVFFLFFVTYSWHQVMYQLTVCLLQCCHSSVIQGNDFWKGLSCSLVLCVFNQCLLFKEKILNVSSLLSLYLGLIVHLYLCVFPAWVDGVSQQKEDNILKQL